ncbi:NUMOD1 domain-containing DNA-binding protein, partial [Peribacillus butanolivorans]
FACKSFVVKASELWNEENSVKEISEILKISISTITKYLKQGKVLGLCDYDPTENNKKPIIQLSLDGEFICEWESAREANRELGINFSAISAVCLGQNISAGGFLWMFEKDYSPKKALEKGKIKKYDIVRKPVIQLSLDGDFIKEWESATEVQRELGIHQTNISYVCKGKKKSAGGFLWIYKEDYSLQKVSDKVKFFKKDLKKRIPIIQLSLNGEFIREWESATKAKEILGISNSNIKETCIGKRKSSGGYKWMYKEDYEKSCVSQ